MPTTSSYLLGCLDSRPEAPTGLDAIPREFLEWIGAMAWEQNLVVKVEGLNDGGVVFSRTRLSELLNDFCCRYLLKEVPSIVKRVQKLDELTTEDAPSEVVQLYFMQAMKCYAMGLSDAAVALTRASLEHALREVLPGAGGIKELEDLIKLAGNYRKLNNAQIHMASRVRILGNRAMHKSSCSSDEAFEAVTMLRGVVGTLYRVADDDWDFPPPQ